MTTMQDYWSAVRARNEIITENRARRMRVEKLPPLPVPPKPDRPRAPFAYDGAGTYVGRLADPDDCPPGCVVRWEPLQ